jgi:hypothetical protein
VGARRSAHPVDDGVSATPTEPAETETKPAANSKSTTAAAPSSVGGRGRRGPRPGENNSIERQREQLARRLLRMQRGQYREERNSQTLDRFLKAKKDFKLPGGGDEDYRRTEIIRTMSKIKRKTKDNS